MKENNCHVEDECLCYGSDIDCKYNKDGLTFCPYVLDGMHNAKCTNAEAKQRAKEEHIVDTFKDMCIESLCPEDFEDLERIIKNLRMTRTFLDSKVETKE